MSGLTVSHTTSWCFSNPLKLKSSCVTVYTHIGLRDFWDAKLTNPAGSGYTIATCVKRFTCRLKKFVLPVWSSPHSMSERRPLPSGCRKKKSVSWHSSRQENSWIHQSRKLPPVWKVTATSPIKPKTWPITPGNATAIYEPLAYTKKHIRGAAWWCICTAFIVWTYKSVRG